MKFAREGDLYILKLEDGESVLDSLKAFASQAKRETYVIVGGVGMLRDLKLGYFVGNGEYDISTLIDPVELLSIQGNIVRGEEGDYIVHAHVVVGTRDRAAKGGHLVSAVVHNTNEIVIKAIDLKATRRREKTTGLLALQL